MEVQTEAQQGNSNMALEVSGFSYWLPALVFLLVFLVCYAVLAKLKVTGENKFIHAPARGSGVRVDDMTTVYWDKRFDGARRVNDSIKDSFQMDLITK